MAIHSSPSISAGQGDADGSQVRYAPGGVAIERHFCPKGVNPFEQATWEKRSASIKGEDGEVIFSQDGVEVPEQWSQLATNVAVSKYFYGEQDSAEREGSVRELVHRVSRTIADWARKDGVFASDEDAETFYDELTWLCLNQYGAFNSPVWFNVGLFDVKGVEGSEGNFHWDKHSKSPTKTLKGYEYPQCSACFIQSVDDTMEDIMRLAASEAMLFKYGSGTGTDLSTLRSSKEKLSGGGVPSGPLSFMRVFDQIAAVVKSGGKTRRAAKMQSLRCDHPDILEFIECKSKEEEKARALIEAGYDGNYNGEAYGSVMYQNSNLSIRITEDFLQAAREGLEWCTHAVTNPQKIVGRHNASELLKKMASSCHLCGDPGVQYDTTINNWHTCPAGGRINASNPCSEYMFLDDSACNLASLNLMKFRRADGSFDVEGFRKAARIFIIAQETLVDHASYPTEQICRNSHEYRPLGLGYANLGALLMSLGWSYDSDPGRAMAAAVTAIMTAEAYATSAELASQLGPFPEFVPNRRAMINVMRMHRQAVENIDCDLCPDEMVQAARAGWDEAISAGLSSGYRNAQTTLLAPTGTIGFLMDCDTTGIEPDIALVKYKLLAGGGMFKLVNQTVPLALEKLGYEKEQVHHIIGHIEEHDTIENAPDLRDEHLSIFDCAFKPVKGSRSIHYTGHLRMMSAVQPFLSGAISKTVNMPKDSTVEDIFNVYMSGWEMGLKAVAIYRDGSKVSQPVNLKKDKRDARVEEPEKVADKSVTPKSAPRRRRLPATRRSLTHKFEVAGHEGYITVGLHDDDAPGEVFITMAKEGSTVGGMMDAFATAISLCLQYGVPLEALTRKFSHQRFEPNGMTANPDIPFAKSIIDYIFRWLDMTFLSRTGKSAAVQRTAGRGGSPVVPVSTGGSRDDSAPGMRGAGLVSGRDASTAGADLLSGGDSGNGGNGGGAAATSAMTDVRAAQSISRIDQQFSHFQEDAPSCDVCGAITVRNGNCYKCFNCGASLGCS